jgi:hypothetical protein
LLEPGAIIVKGDPVERVASEGALDQMLGVSIDENQNSVIFLDSVKDENDVFERSPITGQIDCAKELSGKTISGNLSDLPYLTRDMYVNGVGNALVDYDNSQKLDKFAVSDARWIDSPEELKWKSALLSQLEAKSIAITHFLNDPSNIGLSKGITEEEKKLVARRALQLAAELQDEALNEISKDIGEANNSLQHSLSESRERFLRYTVDTQEEIRRGGLTKAEVNELFEEGI